MLNYKARHESYEILAQTYEMKELKSGSGA